MNGLVFPVACWYWSCVALGDALLVVGLGDALVVVGDGLLVVVEGDALLVVPSPVSVTGVSSLGVPAG